MTRNVKGSPSGKKKVVSDGNMGPHTGMKSSGSADQLGKYTSFFPYYFNLFKR